MKNYVSVFFTNEHEEKMSKILKCLESIQVTRIERFMKTKDWYNNFPIWFNKVSCDIDINEDNLNNSFEGINASFGVIFFVTNKYLLSGRLEKEMNSAFKKQKVVVAILTEIIQNQEDFIQNIYQNRGKVIELNFEACDLVEGTLNEIKESVSDVLDIIPVSNFNCNYEVTLPTSIVITIIGQKQF